MRSIPTPSAPHSASNFSNVTFFVMAVIDQYFKHLVESGASDLHLSEGQPPKMRTHGAITSIAEGILEHDTLNHMLSEICDDDAYERFLEKGDLDFAYEMDEESRFRCNFFLQKNGLGAVFRLIPTKIKTIQELNVPDTIERFGDMRSGLVLVTGPTGSGKSTTLAALMELSISVFCSSPICARIRCENV